MMNKHFIGLVLGFDGDYIKVKILSPNELIIEEFKKKIITSTQKIGTFISKGRIEIGYYKYYEKHVLKKNEIVFVPKSGLGYNIDEEYLFDKFYDILDENKREFKYYKKPFHDKIYNGPAS